jgi:DNA-binding XRE family transcriptional regulator
MDSGISASSQHGATSNLALVRSACGLSRERLAALAGLSPRTIYAIEVEGVQPQRATQRVLAEALGCQPSDLYFNDHDPSVTSGRGEQGVEIARAEDYPTR